PTSHGDPLAHAERRTLRTARGALQSASRSHSQIELWIYARRPVGSLDPPVFAHRHHDRVTEIDELKEGLELMVAVRPTAGDVQEQVDLGGRGPVGFTGRRRFARPLGLPGHEFQPSTTTRKRTP